MQTSTIFWTVNKFNTLVARWMDNGMVLCVSTMHKIGAVIKRRRKRPRVTKLNRQHVNKIWGSEGAAEIFIPTLIDDYNHWMGGVDLSDQRISYYHPDLRCYRSWIPIFIQLLSIIRNNMFIVYREFFKKEAESHKKFTIQVISCLMKKAHEHAEQANSRADNSNSPRSITIQKSKTSGSPKAHKRAQPIFCDRQSMLDNYTQRKTPPLEAHTRVKSNTGARGGCVWCAMQWKEKRAAGTSVKPWDESVKRTSMVCAFCSAQSRTMKNVFLCKEHFAAFHGA